IDDLAKMGKDRDYKPAFNPKSKEVLEKMNAEKRASLENEREEVKEQANQEAYSPMKKAANDDYDMGM
ncbi:DNA methyltransferase, partial [Helicobacter pylori]|nr:DNA methyltransferase [Helicobacter pylori]